MKSLELTPFSALLLFVGSALVFSQAPQSAQWILAKRATLAISYPDDKSSEVNMAGTGLHSNVTGRAETKRSEGRTRVKLRIENLQHPQTLGSYYTSYVVWAITPEGKTENLGELPREGGRSREIEVTTSSQVFGLILTAEPHALVSYPSPMVIAENTLRKNTRGDATATSIEYRGDPGIYYVADASSGLISPDYNTPLLVLGARRSVEIAQRAGAATFAPAELTAAQTKLATLEQVWPPNRRNEEKYSSLAREVMQLGEGARAASVERFEQARLAGERRAAARAVNQAQNEAARANAEAARAQAERERSERELAQAKERLAQAQTEAERAKAREEVARLEAERARLESEQVKRERDQAIEGLAISLAAILETRREARGLIVSLSDVYFDFDKATLKPGAKERLSKLTGVLLAYPGDYRVEIEGHTDSIGSDEYNQRLSESRALAVRDYLTQAGLPADRIVGARGFGKTRPVATNDTPEGRQINRRVEIIIADTGLPTSASRQ
jgi:outer membrane protein OmpA-like peptidoglycan-associated protein